MALSNIDMRLRHKWRQFSGTVIECPPCESMKQFVTEKPDCYQGHIEQFFWENEGRAIDKWLHYLPIYERHFAPFRNAPVRVLEIGVQNAGSAQMWRDWFGPDAILYGIDIDPDCAEANGGSAQIRIGSQADPDFLRRVVKEMGGLDVVIDDGSHVMSHIHESFCTLFPLLSEGGVYLV